MEFTTQKGVTVSVTHHEFKATKAIIKYKSKLNPFSYGTIVKGQYFYDRQSAYQKKLLKSLLESGENVFSVDYAKRFRLSATSTTQKALFGLVESGIVEKVEGTYFIGDPFFKRFLSNYA